MVIEKFNENSHASEKNEKLEALNGLLRQSSLSSIKHRSLWLCGVWYLLFLRALTMFNVHMVWMEQNCENGLQSCTTFWIRLMGIEIFNPTYSVLALNVKSPVSDPCSAVKLKDYDFMGRCVSVLNSEGSEIPNAIPFLPFYQLLSGCRYPTSNCSLKEVRSLAWEYGLPRAVNFLVLQMMWLVRLVQ